MTFSQQSFAGNYEENLKLLHKSRELRELIMTDAQCRSGGEKVVCYLCTTSLLLLLQPHTSLFPVRSLLELMHASLLLVLPSLSFCLSQHQFSLTSLSSSFRLHSLKPWTATNPQWPPIKQAQSPTLLFGSSPFLSNCFLSSPPVNGLWSGKTARFSDANLSWGWSSWDNVLPSWG